MDLKNMLNAQDGVADNRPRHSSAASQRSSLPALNTQSSPSQPTQYPPHPQDYRQGSQHPGVSPHGQPYQMTPTSAYASYPPPMTQTPSYGQPPADLQRHVSHPSQMSTPSSHPQTPYGIQRSPSASRSQSYQQLTYSNPPHHPTTGTPTGQLHLSPSTYHRPPPVEAQYQHHRPPSSVPYGYPPPSRLPSHGSRDNSVHSLLNDRGPGAPLAAPSSAMSPPAPPGSNPHSMYAQHSRPQMSRHGSSMASSRERTHSVSVSPKTMVTGLPASRTGSMAGMPAGPSSDGPEAQFAHPSGVRVRTNSITSSFLRDPTPQDKRRTTQQRDASFLSSPLAPVQRDVPMAPVTETNALKRSKRSFEEQNASSDSVEPPPKRRRGTEIPIWAQMCKAAAPLPKYRKAVEASRGQASQSTSAPARPAQPSPVPQSAMVRLDPDLHANLEDSFVAILPFEDIHRALCDFVFHNVVQNNTFGTTRAGEAASSNLGELEIEAKIGTMIDRSTNGRIRMQAASEVILPHGTNVAFESMMTEEQHANYNKMLNDAVARSLGLAGPLAKPRAKIDYVHRHEVDSFYPLPPAELHGLPSAIIPLATQGGRQPKVRVTKDQKTGDVIAQIVKVRVAEINVHSPLTPFDWRVTISAEAKWDGDVKMLMAAVAGGARNKAQPDRIKDRVSYKHQYSQIDLTQVKPVAGAANEKATHELEVELDAAFVREQGRLNMAGQPNVFEAGVKTLLNNVRLLTRGRF